jgi:hypothetical protein
VVSLSGERKYVTLLPIYENCVAAIANKQIHNTIVAKIYFALPPAYQNIIRATTHNTNKVHRSGINRKIPEISQVITINHRKKPISSNVSRFLNNHDPRNSTNHILKNSQG